MGSRRLGIDDLYRFRTAGFPDVSPDGARVAFIVAEADRERDRQLAHVWLVEEGEPPRQLTRGERGESAPQWSPDGRRLAFLAARGGEDAKPQVWALELGGGEPWPVTEAGGGVTAFRWSPDGRRIAFTAIVEPEGDDEHADARPIVVRRLLYKADGAGLLGERRSHLFVLTLEGGEVLQRTRGDLFAAWPAWSPDGSQIAFTAATHEDRDLDPANHVFVVGSRDGSPRQVTSGTWMAAAPFWTGDGSRLIFAGQRRLADLQTSLWAVDPAGGEPVDLLPELDRSVMVGGPGYPGAPPARTADGSALVFCARIGGCTHAFRLPLDGGPPQPLLAAPELVVKGVGVSARAGVAAAAVGSPDSPGDIVRVDLESGATRRLTELNRDLLAEAPASRPELRRFRAPDGVEVEGWLWRGGEGGENDEPGPLLLDIHGGPHNAWTPALDPDHLFHDELLARGWSVLAINPRGSDGYGARFMAATHGCWGEGDQQDFEAALDAVIEEGIADPGRIAVTGYSYGGFMTSWLIGHTDRFAAAVAGAVAVDLASIAGTMDVGVALSLSELGADPLEDPALYERLSPLRSAGRITTPTLILHGQADERCPAGQAEQLFSALRARRRQVELVLYPGASHLFIVQGRPSHRVDYGRRVVDWVTRHVDGTGGEGP